MQKGILKRILFSFITVYLVTGLVFAGLMKVAEFYDLYVRIAVCIAAVLLSLGVLIGFMLFMRRVFSKRIEMMTEKNRWFQAVVDAVDVPVHAVDRNGNWIFMNRAFEKVLAGRGIIANRDEAVGRHCSLAGTEMGKYDNIELPESGKAEGYFNWGNLRCRYNISEILDKNGRNVGFVEVVHDLTPILSIQEYTQAGIERLKNNLDRLAAGNVELDLTLDEPNEYTKETSESFKVIVDDLKNVSESVGRMIDEMMMLSRAAAEGRLEIRADASRHKGRFYEIVDGMNKAMDAVAAPLEVAMQYIAKIADSEDLPELENTFQGRYARLIDNLNTVGNASRVTAEEIGRMLRSASEGDFSVRGDTGKLKGNNAMAVELLNETFKAVEAPLNEASAVLGKVAFNDYTLSMTGQYHGIFGKLAESINTTLFRLRSVQDALERAGAGDLSRLPEFLAIGRRSENDHLLPALISTYQSIQDMIDETAKLTDAAINGNLSIRGDLEKFQGGYRKVIEGFNRTIDAILEPVRNAQSVVAEMAAGNLSVEMKGNYKGDYLGIQESVNRTIQAFNDILRRIDAASEQVAVGSRQVSQAAQELSQSSSEQASSIEELTASIEEISFRTRQNAKDANDASGLADMAKNNATRGHERMAELLKAMDEIQAASDNISKIIKMIDEIAFQTNILALNAAVEAARAGQYGKGFAVVAEEVKNLASKSAKAAKETGELIENSVALIGRGVELTNDTNAALDKILEDNEEVVSIVKRIAEASNEQANSIEQVNQGIVQVSKSIQVNSATSEEEASASAELLKQAEELRKLVDQFRLQSHDDDEIAQAAAAEQAQRPPEVAVHAEPVRKAKPAIPVSATPVSKTPAGALKRSSDQETPLPKRPEISLEGGFGKY